MKLMIGVAGAVMWILLLQSMAAYADDIKVIVKAENKEDFTTVVAAVHQQMAPGGRYEYVNKDERVKVEAALGDMQSLFDKYGTVQQMDQGAKVQLFNDQELVNTTLTRRDGDRRICESVAPMGSHIPKTVCRTYREIEMQHQQNQNYLQHMQQVQEGVGGKS